MKVRIPFFSIIAVIAVVFVLNGVIGYASEAKTNVAVMNTVTETAASVETNSTEVTLPETSEVKEAAYASPINFGELKNINSDVVSCIKINDNDTQPVLFDGTDKYLHSDLYGNRSSHGSIYMDGRLDSNGALQVFYGHHMKDGSMFAIIDEMAYSSELYNNSSIDVYYEDHEITLKPMCAIVGVSDGRLLNIKSANEITAFAKDKSLKQGEIVSDYEGTLYVTVTCNYSGNDYRTYIFWTEA